MAAATAAAKSVRATSVPATVVVLTRIGWLIALRARPERLKFCRASVAKLDTRSRSRRSAEPRGSLRAARPVIAEIRFSPRTENSLPSTFTLPPCWQQPQIAHGDLRQRAGNALVRARDGAVDRIADGAAPQGVLLVQEDLHPGAIESRAQVLLGHRRDHERAEDVTVAHLLDRLLTRAHPHGVHPVPQLPLGQRQVELLPSDLNRRLARRRAHDGHLGPVG